MAPFYNKNPIAINNNNNTTSNNNNSKKNEYTANEVKQEITKKAIDEQLLDDLLMCINPKIVQSVLQKCKISVQRNNITKYDASLKGSSASNNSYALDLADGVCASNMLSCKIVIRSVAKEGNVIIDFQTLLHEIGHAFDTHIFTRDNAALSKWKDYADIVKEELKGFTNNYFHDPAEFFAEVFAMYCLDKSRTQAKFPKAVKILDEEMKTHNLLKPNEAGVDKAKLVQVLNAMIKKPIINCNPPLFNEIKNIELLNKDFYDNKLPEIHMVLFS